MIHDSQKTNSVLSGVGEKPAHLNECVTDHPDRPVTTIHHLTVLEIAVLEVTEVQSDIHVPKSLAGNFHCVPSLITMFSPPGREISIVLSEITRLSLMTEAESISTRAPTTSLSLYR